MALRGKLAWKMGIRENRKWIHICQKKYLQDGFNFIKTEQPKSGSGFWKGLLKIRHLLKENIIWSISNGKDVEFWEDAWINGKALIQYPNLANLACWGRDNVGWKVQCYMEEVNG